MGQDTIHGLKFEPRRWRDVPPDTEIRPPARRGKITPRRAKGGVFQMSLTLDL